MIITLPSGKKAKLIGDPHLGKKFETGVPLHRRGEREKKQMEKFIAELSTPDVDYNIMVGDLFDHPHVGYGVTVAAAEAYRAAAKANPSVEYVALAGNHDLPRNLGVVGAWDAFEKMTAGVSNLIVTRQTLTIYGEIVCFPWDWTMSAAQQVENFSTHPKVKQFSTAVGHWDLRSYGGDDSHMAPVDELHAHGITDIYGGHYHTAGDYDVAGGVVHCTGSMEPYSHAEDPDGEIYVTLTLYEAFAATDLHDKCVRILLKDGEEVPYDLDCLALTYKRETEHSEQLQTIGAHDFDWRGIMDEALAPLHPDVRTFIQDRIGS